MGFQDSHTDVPHKGKDSADGLRYKALGNSWAVNCARWIGERIASVDCIAAGDSGSNEAMAELNRARDEALEAIK